MSCSKVELLFNQLLITMDAIVETEKNVHLLDNKCLTANTVYKAVVSAPSNQIRNISVLQKLH